MKSAGKQYLPVALLMAAIVAVCAIVTALAGAVGVPSTASGTRRVVVTTSYPLYIAARTVAADVDSITVENLMGSAAGCMHNYQLTPANRVVLDRADLVLMGSAETETFMLDVLAQLDCPVVDTVHRVEVTADEHHRDEHEHDHEHDHAAEEHAWMQPAVYASQVEACAAWLMQIDPDNADAYRERMQAYVSQIAWMQRDLTSAAEGLPSRVCITFHDSVKGFAESLGLTVAASLTVGEDAGVSAGDLATVQAVLEQHPDALLLYDDQYAIRYTAVDRLVSARQVLALDTVVAGDRLGDDWIDAMTTNANLLRQVTEG